MRRAIHLSCSSARHRHSSRARGIDSEPGSGEGQNPLEFRTPTSATSVPSRIATDYSLYPVSSSAGRAFQQPHLGFLGARRLGREERKRGAADDREKNFSTSAHRETSRWAPPTTASFFTATPSHTAPRRSRRARAVAVTPGRQPISLSCCPCVSAWFHGYNGSS